MEGQGKKNVDSEGFITVCHKGKRKKSCKSRQSKVVEECDETDVNIVVFLEKLSTLEVELKNSDFMLEFMKSFAEVLQDYVHLHNLSSASVKELTEGMEQISLKDTNDVDIICYGLGKFLSCKSAQHQLAFLLVLQCILNKPNVYIYDPLFSNKEKELLRTLKLNVLECNEQGKRTINRFTIFFMPHCGKPLYNSVLWANWNVEKLSKLIIIGNSFKTIIECIPKKLLLQEVCYLYKAANFVEEVSIPNTFKFCDVFNNTSIHTFNLSKLNLLPTSTWLEVKEPHYTSEEIIT